MPPKIFKGLSDLFIPARNSDVIKLTDKTDIGLPHSEKLQSEISEVRLDGYEVSVGHTEDEAYSCPEMIVGVFEYLDAKGKEYASLRDEVIRRELGVASLEGMSPSVLRKSYARQEGALEDIRAGLLFDETKMPWHLQRGSALALQTIIDAHELKVADDNCEESGIYSTMGGRLPYYDGEFKFDEADGSLSGLALSDAIIRSRQRFYGESVEDASARANETLSKLDTFLNALVTQEFKNIVAYCSDSLGIRSRKQEVRRAVSGHMDKVLQQNPGKDKATLLSVGCGTADAILEVASDLRQRGVEPSVILLDQDPVALAAAKNLAEQVGLQDVLEVHCERLFDQKGQPFDMNQILDGRKVDVAEDTGLREYLPDSIYRNLTHAVWDHLSPDGIMTSGNMNVNRPQPEFLHGLMGWSPSVIMRSISKGFELHEESGIPKGCTEARVTRDGVYTLFFSYK